MSEPSLTDDEIKWFRQNKMEWERMRWLGRLGRRTLIYLAAAITAVYGFLEFVLTRFNITFK